MSWAIPYEEDFMRKLACVILYITLKREKEMKEMRLLHTGAAWNTKCTRRLVEGAGCFQRARKKKTSVKGVKRENASNALKSRLALKKPQLFTNSVLGKRFKLQI